MGERMTKQQMGDASGNGHYTRYFLARGFVEPGDTVLDAACGIGYASELMKSIPDVTYIGVDKFENKDYDFDLRIHDLTTYQPDFEYDVAISFETIEHVDDYSNILKILQNAKKWFLCSVPTVPTKHINPWHKHDFAPGELPNKLENNDWEYFNLLKQPTELAEIYIFKRRSV